MKPMRTTGLIILACLGIHLAPSAKGQETPEVKALMERADRLEKQNQLIADEIQRRRAAADATKQVVQDELKAADAAVKEKAADEKATQATAGYEVGSDRKLNISWNNDGVHFTSANKDFDLHLGGRINTDTVWWHQPSYLKGPAPGSAGIPGSKKGDGFGVYDDGTFLRRIRIRSEGTLYENFEFQYENDFETLNRISLREAYVGVKELPVVGTVRIGQTKVPMGLECYSSSRYVELMERSAVFDTFWQEFAPGITFTDALLDQRATYQAMLHRVELFQQYNGATFGDGNGAFTGRLTALPLYDESGRCYVHTAASYQFRTGNLGRTIGGTGTAFGDSRNVVRFRDRAEIRDSIGATTDVLGNAGRVVDTGYLATEGVNTVAVELLAVDGPVYLQAEATAAQVEHARRVDSAAAFALDHGSPTFYGMYGQVGYFLTGESRPYNRRFGVYDRVVPNSNFFLVRDRSGQSGWSLGGLEVLYRASFVDLNGNGITGGIATEHTLGLNWIWTPNMRMQFNYTTVSRNHVGVLANAGTVQGVGVRTMIDF